MLTDHKVNSPDEGNMAFSLQSILNNSLVCMMILDRCPIKLILQFPYLQGLLPGSQQTELGINKLLITVLETDKRHWDDFFSAQKVIILPRGNKGDILLREN